jgi:hypothetical protein
MARFLDRVILFVVSWWSNNQDPQQNENNEARGEARRRGSTSTVVPAGSCHIMSANIDAASYSHHMESPIGE